MPQSDQIDDSAIRAFNDQLRGDLLEPEDDGYDDARTIWNAMIDREPAMIARCTGTADVISAVNFARENAVRLSVKSGGHHVSGAAVCEDGLMIDLSRMNAVRVDPDAKNGPGSGWFDVERYRS
jgi:FAD/FMN-containing dehydrogenase